MNMMAAMKACKTCSEQVAKSAKICPHCGAKLKSGWIKKFLIAWFLIAVVVALYRAGSDDGNVSVAGGGDANQDNQIVDIDQNITSGSIEVQIVDISIGTSFKDTTGILSAEAQPGATLIAVLSNFKNVGAKPFSSFSLPVLSLIDPNGTKLEADIGKSAAYAGIKEIDQKVLSDIAPGLRSQDASVFEVSSDAFEKKGWKLQIGSIKKIMYRVN
jgi:hypothetical protein